MGKTKVCILGLGQIGLPVAQYVQSMAFEVVGYDINPATVANTGKTGKFKVTSKWDEVPNVDIYICCVTTSQVNDKPDLSPVFDVCKKIAEKATSDSLVSIESTIIPGTSKKIFEEIFKSKILLVHAPHRYWADEPKEHGVNQIRVIGGVNQKSLNAGLKFYKSALKIPMHKVSQVEVAEMCKIIENSHRYLQIAFAEELKMMSAKLGMDFDELRDACNSKWNVDIPEARDGIGRHCLPKDIRYVTSIIPDNILLQSAVQVDKKYREWLAQKK